MSHLLIDESLVAKARESAKIIACQVKQAVNGLTTSTIERASLRLLGIDGVNTEGVPLVNIVVEHLAEQNLLDQGALTPVVAAMDQQGLSAQAVATAVACGELTLTKSDSNSDKIKNKTLQLASEACRKIAANRQ